MSPRTPAELIAEFTSRGGALSSGPTTTAAAVDPIFAYDRPETHGSHVEKIIVPLRDGSHLAGELHRPAGPDGEPAPGRFPGIVIEYNGYGVPEFFGGAARHFVTRGYVAAVCSVRGTGASPGKVDPFGAQEQRDNVDLIEWLAEQPFSTGKVGQMGTSYGGHTAMLAAVNQPPHLTAVIGVQAISDWYENTIFRGGIPNAQIREWQRTTAPDTLAAYPEHPRYDDYWRERSVKARWDRLTVPVLDIGGWLDPYRDAMVQNFQARQQNVWMVAGPWEHGMVPGQFEDIAAAVHLAWWDHWLSDLPVPLPVAKVTSYEMPRAGWRQYSTWPPAESAEISLALGDGVLAEDAVPTTQSFAANTERLTFATRPLDHDVVVVGGIEATVRASFTADDGNLALVLDDVTGDGTATRISNGWLKASHRDGSETTALVTPGEAYDLRVPLWPIHHRVAAGHTLRLTASSDDHPLVDTDAPAGAVTVHAGSLTFRTMA
jgi:predicted acyl esterase